MKYGKILLLFAVLLAGACKDLSRNDAKDVAVAFYNCENFFGLQHDPGKDISDFTPEGKYRYTRKIYEQKLRNIATVIQSMNGGKGPAVMGLAEVENNAVLNDLVHQPEIVRRNYKYIIIDGPDERGINVALLYDPQLFRELSAEPVRIDLDDIEQGAKTRDVLHVLGVLDGDTVHVFVNHWPSRRGGEISAPKRMKAAAICKRAIDELVKQDPSAQVIFMGDFNDSPPDSSISMVLGATANKTAVQPGMLYDPWADYFAKGQGTEAFGHEWNLFDQVMVSGTLLESGGHRLRYEKAEIYKPDFLVDHSRGHEGTPKRSFAGTHWMNGYSDHFPVILYLSEN